MGTKKSSVKYIEFDRSSNHWKVSGFDNGVRCDNVILTDVQELHLMQSFTELAQDYLWNRDESEGDKAIEYLNKALNFAPNSRSIRKSVKYKLALISVYRDRAQAYIQTKDYSKAIEDANMAIKVDPKDAYAYNVRAQAYLHSGNEGAACLDYIKEKEVYDSDDNNGSFFRTVPLWKRLYRAIKNCFRHRAVEII